MKQGDDMRLIEIHDDGHDTDAPAGSRLISISNYQI